MTIDGLDSLGGPAPTTSTEQTFPRKKAGLTAKHQTEVLEVADKFRAWLNGPVLELYQTGDALFPDHSPGLKELKATLDTYQRSIVEMGKTSESMQREMEYAPEVLGLSNWYYGDLYGVTSDLMNEIDRLLSVFDGNNSITLIQNNLVAYRFRQSVSSFRVWINEHKAKLLALRNQYQAYEPSTF